MTHHFLQNLLQSENVFLLGVVTGDLGLAAGHVDGLLAPVGRVGRRSEIKIN